MPNTFSLSDVRKLLEQEVAQAGSGMALAEKWGVSQSLISRVLSGKEPPGPTLLRRLRLRRVTRYEEYPL